MLTRKNKSKLPNNSYPGVYKIPCKIHTVNPYIGETKIQIRSRNLQHQENTRKEKWDQSGVVSHSRLCEGVNWNEIETVCVERNRFNRKVREALEIQYNKSGPDNGGMNLDDGDYLKTKFWMPFMSHLKKFKTDQDRRRFRRRASTEGEETEQEEVTSDNNATSDINDTAVQPDEDVTREN